VAFARNHFVLLVAIEFVALGLVLLIGDHGHDGVLSLGAITTLGGLSSLAQVAAAAGLLTCLVAVEGVRRAPARSAR
jgi:hypothetical protein